MPGTPGTCPSGTYTLVYTLYTPGYTATPLLLGVVTAVCGCSDAATVLSRHEKFIRFVKSWVPGRDTVRFRAILDAYLSERVSLIVLTKCGSR